jgi:hypothetical protein
MFVDPASKVLFSLCSVVYKIILYFAAYKHNKTYQFIMVL